jgi:hypothetical protein
MGVQSVLDTSSGMTNLGKPEIILTSQDHCVAASTSAGRPPVRGLRQSCKGLGPRIGS